MELSISSLSKKDLTKFQGITSGRVPIPILSNILIKTDGDNLILSATNLEVSISQTFKTDCVMKLGTTTVDCKKFTDIIDRLDKNTPITISATERMMSIEQGASKFSLHTLPFDDHPVTPDAVGEPFEIDQSMFFQALKRVMYAASTDTSRFNLNGVLIENNIMVATDGHRLSKSELPFNSPNKLLIPSSSCNTITKCFPGSGRLNVVIEEKRMLLKDNDVSVWVRFLDGDYPDYTRVIPSDPTTPALVNKDELLKSLKRVSSLISPHDTGINVLVSDNTFKLSKTSDIGAAEDSFPCEFTGEFAFIANVKYITEATSAIETDQIAVQFYKEGAPIVFKPEPENSHFSLVMPMRK